MYFRVAKQFAILITWNKWKEHLCAYQVLNSAVELLSPDVSLEFSSMNHIGVLTFENVLYHCETPFKLFQNDLTTD